MRICSTATWPHALLFWTIHQPANPAWNAWGLQVIQTVTQSVFFDGFPSSIHLHNLQNPFA